MYLDEKVTYAQGRTDTSETGHVFPVASTAHAHATWLLHAVGEIKHAGHVIVPQHEIHASEVHHQRVVSIGGATLGDPYLLGRFGLAQYACHVPWCQELSLLDVDDLVRVTHRPDQVGLPAQDSGYLQHVHMVRPSIHDVSYLCHVMHVSEGVHSQLLLDGAEVLQCGVHAHATPAFQAGAIGLVITGLEHVFDAVAPAGVPAHLGDLHALF